MRHLGNPGLCTTIFLLASWLPAWTQNVPRADGIGKNEKPLVARGEYIVNGIAACGQCHTPRNADGSLDRSRWLEGAPLWLNPARPTQNWPLEAPRIAGTPAAGDSDMITLLTTGIWINGARLRPPMPQFRMTRQDAEAVVAYLRSLRPSP